MAEEEFASFRDITDWIYVGMTVLCILCAGLAAGLTIGLVSIDRNELRLLMINGTEEQKMQAARILPVIKDHHWLLVTLFLFNATANEALPIFLSGLVPEYVAVILATFSVLIFGEILPSSIFSGPNQLQIASSLSGVVNVLMIIFYVVARPIGLFLDYWLGKHEEGEAPFNAKDLYTLLSLSKVKAKPSVRLDVESGMSASLLENDASQLQSAPSKENLVDEDDESHRAPELLHQRSQDNLLDPDSVLIAQGAIVCSRIGVETIMQPTYHTVSAKDVVNVKWFEAIGRCGFSRVLVTSGSTGGPIVGYILVKELLSDLGKYLGMEEASSEAKGSSKKQKKKSQYCVGDLAMHNVEYFRTGTSVLDALNTLQQGASRLGAVTATGSAEEEALGYFSMEDVLEEIIQEEIEDEKDFRRTALRIIRDERTPSSRSVY